MSQPGLFRERGGTRDFPNRLPFPSEEGWTMSTSVTCPRCGCEFDVGVPRRLQVIDCGYVHGNEAGRISAHEQDDGTWHVVWHPVRGVDVLLKSGVTERDVAVDYGWSEFGTRMGWVPS